MVTIENRHPQRGLNAPPRTGARAGRWHTGRATDRAHRAPAGADRRGGRRLRLLGSQPRPQPRRGPGVPAACAVRPRPAAAARARPLPPRRVRPPATSTHVLCDDAVEAVVIATPPKTHYPLAMRALQAGKHVLVEKPLATRLDDGLELAELARASGLMLMPGHTFIYSPAVNTVRDLIQSRRRRRHPLRHLLADEPRQVPARRGRLRPGAARPLDPALLARASPWSRSPRREAACSGRTCPRPRS